VDVNADKPPPPATGRRWQPALRRNWLARRFSLRTLLVVVTGICLILGFLGESARRQRQAVEAIEALGGTVGYASLLGTPIRGGPAADTPLLPYVRATIGRDYFERAAEVHLSRSGVRQLRGRVGELAPHLARLAPLDSLSLFSLTLEGDDAEKVFRSANPRRASCAMMTLSDSDAAGIACAANLRELGFNDTTISVKGIANFKSLPHLENLWISCRHSWISPSGKEIVWDAETHALRDDVASVLAGFPKLKSLSLSWTQLTDVGIDALTRFDRFKTFGVSSPQVTDASMQFLVRCKKLECLSVAGTKIGDASLPLLQELPRLTTLSLSGAVTNDGLIEVAKLRQLESLDLGGRQIDDAGLPHLAGMENLRRLDVQTTGVTTDGAAVKALKKALPQCHIRQYYPSPSFR
jgi:hypothetical protein